MTPPHGTYKRYDKHGCKCTECRRANAKYHEQLRYRRSSRPLPKGIKHNRSTYYNYGCGCDICMEDARRYLREYRRRQKAS